MDKVIASLKEDLARAQDYREGLKQTVKRYEDMVTQTNEEIVAQDDYIRQVEIAISQLKG